MTLRRPAALAATATLLVGLSAAPAVASHDVTPARAAGTDRVDTAARLATLSHPDGSDEAIVANGRDFPDALAGASAAASYDAPILLVEQDEAPERTLDALDELGVEHVTVLGGQQAVADEVEATIAQSLRVSIDRLAGGDRNATAVAIAADVFERAEARANHPGGQRAVVVANGRTYADALAAGPVAAQDRGAPIPILLTEQDELPEVTADAVADLGVDLAIVVGGEAAVDADVAASLEDEGATVTRVAGDTRTATAAAVADYGREYLDLDASSPYLVRGDAFPDALAAAPLAGRGQDPVLLTRTPDEVTAPTTAWFERACAEVDRVTAIGGQQAVTTAALEQVETAAEDCHGTTDQTFVVEPQEPLEPEEGASVQFEVVRRYDTGDAVETPLDVALFPCASELGSDGGTVYRDEDEDGEADDIGTTETSMARILRVEQTTYDAETQVSDVTATDAEAGVQVEVGSAAEDCVAIVFFEDVDDDDQLDLADDGTPSEPWGHGRAEWQG